MKPALLSAIVAISFASANNVFAGAQKAVDQLNSQAPQQKAAVLPEASAETTAVVFTENGKPVRTIFFEADKLKFNFGDFFGNNGNNPGNHPGPGPGGHPGDFPGNHPGPGPGGFPGNHPGPGGFPGNSYGRMSCVAQDTGWEEHWGGHGNGPSELYACQECLKVHGSCRYSCSVQQFRCTAQFNPAPAPVVPGQPVPPVPAPTPYTGDLRPDQGSAQDNAALRCMQYNQGVPGNCTVTGCNTENMVVNSGRCRN